jgi:hypothetical protein
MNERIKELAKQSGLVRCGDWGMKRWEGPRSENITDLDLNKFAELIVRECLDIIGEEKCGVEVSNNLAPLETLWSVECAIKENFGVEE